MKSNNHGELINKVWQFCREDINRVMFSLKAGLAVLLVSFLILFRAPYDVFGTNVIWAILTVAVLFEFTVGATLSRGVNRVIGSIVAGVLTMIVFKVALSFGNIIEPTIIGASIFLIGVVTSFLKLWPSLVPYAYAFRVTLFTYSLLIVQGYRIGNPLKSTLQRLYSIGIGAVATVLVNMFIFPVWAGDQLHNELVKNFDSVADFLQECIKKYYEDNGINRPKLSKSVTDEFADEPAYRRCQETLNSLSKLETLETSAKWEPPHGRFRRLFYPWSEYIKVGVVLRRCAYIVMAFHGVLHSEKQAPNNIRIAFQSAILDATNHAAELVRSLGNDVRNMSYTPKTTLQKKVHASVEHLQQAIDIHFYLLASSIENFNYSPQPLKSTPKEGGGSEDTELPTSPQPQCTTSVPDQAESYRKVKKMDQRLHPEPSTEAEKCNEGGHEMDNLSNMISLETKAVLSLATFTSLLIEFADRLDRLVEAVNGLAKMAKFKNCGR